MARRMTAVFILLARRIAKDVRAPDVTAGVAQGHEQFGSQRSDRSIACTRLARSSTYDLDSRAGHNGADGYRRAAVETVRRPRRTRICPRRSLNHSRRVRFEPRRFYMRSDVVSTRGRAPAPAEGQNTATRARSLRQCLCSFAGMPDMVEQIHVPFGSALFHASPPSAASPRRLTLRKILEVIRLLLVC
jgi:hypothetical protein